MDTTISTNVRDTTINAQTRQTMIEFFGPQERAAAQRVRDAARGTDADEQMSARRAWIEPALALLYWSEDDARRLFLARNCRVALEREMEYIRSALSYDKIMDPMNYGRIPRGLYGLAQVYMRQIAFIDRVIAEIAQR